MKWISACSAGNGCVEIALCESAGCVEISQDGASVLIRDSKDPDGPQLVFTREEWDQFLEGARGGVFDL
jgi:hypothetical protein